MADELLLDIPESYLLVVLLQQICKDELPMLLQELLLLSSGFSDKHLQVIAGCFTTM